MSDEPNTKVCLLCAETIKSVAKVCPHCRYHQKRWSLQNPMVLVAVTFTVLLGPVLGMGILFDREFGPKEHFAEYRDQISILGFQVSQRISSSNSIVTVAGTLTNRSRLGWKEVSVEARFLDKSGKVFDAITASADDYRGVSVLPHDVAAFKIEGRMAAPAAVYDNCKVSVRWAKDADAWP